MYIITNKKNGQNWKATADQMEAVKNSPLAKNFTIVAAPVPKTVATPPEAKPKKKAKPKE